MLEPGFGDARTGESPTEPLEHAAAVHRGGIQLRRDRVVTASDDLGSGFTRVAGRGCGCTGGSGNGCKGRCGQGCGITSLPPCVGTTAYTQDCAKHDYGLGSFAAASDDFSFASNNCSCGGVGTCP